MSNQQNSQNQQAGGVSSNSSSQSFNQQGLEAESRHHKMQQQGVNPHLATPPGGVPPYGAGTYGVPGMYPYGHYLHGYGAAPFGYGHGHFYHPYGNLYPYGYHHHFGWHHPFHGYGYPNYPYGTREFANYNYQQPFANEQVQESSFAQGFEGFPYTNQVIPGIPYAPYGQPQFAANPYQGFNPQQQPGQVIQGTSTPVRKDRKSIEANSFRGTDASTSQNPQ